MYGSHGYLWHTVVAAALEEVLLDGHLAARGCAQQPVHATVLHVQGVLLFIFIANCYIKLVKSFWTHITIYCSASFLVTVQKFKNQSFI